MKKIISFKTKKKPELQCLSNLCGYYVFVCVRVILFFFIIFLHTCHLTAFCFRVAFLILDHLLKNFFVNFF